MKFEDFKALQDQIHNGGFTRAQLGELLGTVVGRVCRMDEPELEALGHDLSEACEAYDAAIDEVEAREARFLNEPDECALAKDHAIAVQEGIR